MGPTMTINEKAELPATETLEMEQEGQRLLEKRAAELQHKSMTKIVWEQFLEHKLAVIGLVVITFFIFLSLGAPLISSITGIDPNEQNVFHRFKGPFTYVPFTGEKTEQRILEYVKENTQESSETILAIQHRFPEAFTMGPGQSPAEFLGAVLAELDQNEVFRGNFSKAAQEDSNMERFLAMRRGLHTFHLLGTDELGRDVCMRLIYGTRVSISIGLIVAAASALIGVLIGSLSGYYGGFLDTCLMRITDALLSLPLLPVLIVFAAVDLKKIPLFHAFLGTESESIFKLVFILCIFSWMTVARLVRGSILSIKEREFIQAAQTLGATDRTIILSHIIPNTIPPLLVSVTLNIGQSILSEAALSFLGLGIQPPLASWGNMLFNAQEMIYEAPLQAVLPGLFILLIVVSFNFVGDGLQDAIDPRSMRR